MADPAPVCVIVPVHAQAPSPDRCLASIRATRPPPAEVLVVLDGPVPAIGGIARAHGFGVIELTVTGGPARARNEGARAAASPILFFVDSDVELPHDAVGRVLEHFERDPGLTALFGSYDAQPAEPAFLSQYRNLLHHFVHQTSSPDASTFWAACGAIRREAFLSVSGFDESYKTPSVEDIELGYRLKRAGARILLDPTLQVKHLKGWNLTSTIKTDLFLRAAPWAALLLEGRGGKPDLNLKATSRWSVLAVLALLLTFPLALLQSEARLLFFLLILVLVALNLSFYRFLLRERGVWFAARAIPSHWLFYVCGGLGFALALSRSVGRPWPTEGSRAA